MKRILSISLAVILSLTLFVTGAYADNSQQGYSLGLSGMNTALSSYSLGEEVRPGDEADFYIFLNGKHALRQDIRSDKIDVRQKTGQGSKVVKKVSMKYDKDGYAYIKVEFVDPFVSTKEQDFNFTLYLTANKNRMKETELEISGTLENYIQYVDDGQEHVDMTDWPLVEAEDYIRSIEAYLGQGLSIHTRMFADRKYYGYVRQEISAADDEVVSQYPSIDTIYYLQTIGMNTASNYVTFDMDNSRMYVYNADLEYLGTTSDRLPYSTKYYVSTTVLDVDDTLDDELDDLEDAGNPEMGGDDLGDNIHDNPGTGR